MDDSAFKSHGGGTKPQPKYPNDSILESLRAIGSGVGKSIVKDVTGKVASDALSSLFGAPAPKQGDMRPNIPFSFQKDYDTQSEAARFPGFRRPEMQTRAPFVHREEPQLKEQIFAVQQELKALASSIKSLNTEITKTVMEAPVDPGIYHKNFFDRLRSVLKLLREQIDDSRTWLSVSANRKKKKGYWGSYKKHGTSFGLSNERTLATQAG